MSVSDPLIRDIKGHILKVFIQWQRGNEIIDTNSDFLSLCSTLEKIFFKGLIQHQHSNFRKVDTEMWMVSVARESEHFVYRTIVEEMQSCKALLTLTGKFRFLVRYCLAKKCLHVPFDTLMNLKKMAIFYEKNSIIGDEILLTILLSLLLQCSKIYFRLRLDNYYFLDSTWQVPEMVKLELVPCKSLGMSISFSDNKAVIVHITSDSVASESVDISKGDILANLNGIEINSSCKGRLNSILRINKGRPISVTVIKALSRGSDEIFPPIKRILVDLQMDVDQLRSLANQIENDQSITSEKSQKLGYNATYLGFVDVGDKGSVKQIEEAMKHRLSLSIKKREQVVIEIGEMNVKIFNADTNEVLLKHSYMQISSCGSAPNLPNYIAYIAGNENCDTASNFICYIFHMKDTEEAFTVLKSIGQGFYRTHFAV